jgi:DtxR family Mn-dependent transcriptional regulator
MDHPALTPSQEDYLEAIYHLIEANGTARSKDIADRLRVRRASVTGALRNLAELGMIHYKPYSLVTLTPEGRMVARDVIRRHETLREFFIAVLHVDPALADDCACKMEHNLPREIMDRLIQFLAETKHTTGK